MISLAYYKIQEILLCAMIISLPLMRIPDRYTLFSMGNNLSMVFLFFSIFLFIVYSIWKKKTEVPFKLYFIISVVWIVFCTILGVFSFPFYDTVIYTYLINTSVVQKLYTLFPSFVGNEFVLQVKLMVSLVWYLFRNFIFPLIGLFLIIFNLYKDDYKKGLDTIVNASRILTILCIAYSIIEVSWLWSGSDYLASILVTINNSLYDPVVQSGWWPPELWPGQLRSLALEPSYFSMIGVFLAPLLGIHYVSDKNKLDIVLAFLLISMIFLTKARTGVVIYLFELAAFVMLSLVFRYTSWWKICLFVIGLSVLSYSFAIVGDSVASPLIRASISEINTVDGRSKAVSVEKALDNYIDSNVKSVSNTSSRSNSARFGNTVAMFKVGLDYPLFGVGRGLHSNYMVDRFPDFAKDSEEVKQWTGDVLRKGFLAFEYPVLNEFAAILAWFGVIGELLFITPILYILYKTYRIRRHIQNPTLVYLLVAFFGQIVCFMSNEFILAYPTLVGILICYIKFYENSNI